MNQEFLKDVDAGLSAEEKTLSSKYFYDEIGDQLFVQIMHMPEYYLTNAEFEIFSKQTDKIISGLDIKEDTYFELIELGAGDGTKTKELLRKLLERNFDFSYNPVDISEFALEGLKKDLKNEMPTLKVETQQGDYFKVLAALGKTEHPKVVLFLGSNLGNLMDDLAASFLEKLCGTLSHDDKLFLGVDLIKSADIVIPAYQDAQGITSKFNINLLTRINNELGGNFDEDKFYHKAYYTEEEGIAKSYIISKEKQEVNITALNKSFLFEAEEKIHVEISRKYNDSIIEKILAGTNMEVSEKLTDENGYFADYVISKK